MANEFVVKNGLIVSGSSQFLGPTTGHLGSVAINAATQSLQQWSASLQVWTSSIHTFTSSVTRDSASFNSRINLKTDQTVFVAYSQSINTFTASVIRDSASFDSRINLKTDQSVFTAYSQSTNLFTASVTRDSASFNSRINLKTDQTVFVAYSQSINTFTASVIRDSASFDSRINAINTSNYTLITEFRPFSQSIHDYTASAKLDSASFDAKIALKANINSPTFTGTVSGIDKTMVGLGNVDNTSDANKPVSTATQTALNLKTDQTVFVAYTQSINTFTASVTRDSASFNSRINLKTDQTVFVAYTQSINTFTASVTRDSASFNSRINLKTDQTVFVAYTQSINNYTASGIITLSNAPSNQSYSGIVVNFTYGESITIGDLLYMGSADTVYRADSNGGTKFPVMGLALATASSGTNLVLLQGFYRDDTRYNFTVGGVVYLSTTIGTETQTAPSAEDDVIQVVGVATHADKLFFNPQLVMATAKA